MKILITGCAGFIGFHLAKKLIELNFDVTGLDNINDYYDVELKYDRLKELGVNKEDILFDRSIKNTKYSNFDFHKMDLTDQESIFRMFNQKKFDLVCHLAAQAGVRYSITDPQAYIDSNLVGYFNILEACRKFNIKHLLYASSSSVYGLNKETPFSTNHGTDRPASLYAATKKSNELMAHAYSHIFNLPTTGLRFFTVYGPWGRPDMALYLFTKAIVENKPIQIFNNGNMKRDFTYVDDIVDGIVKIITKTDKNQKKIYNVYNIGKGSSIGLNQFITEIEKNLDIISQKEFLPMQDGDVPTTWSDISEMQRDFNYKPKVDVAKGVKSFINWYIAYYDKKKAVAV